MAIATGTALAVGAGLSAVGGLLNARNQNKQAKQQQTYNQGQATQLRGAIQNGPSALDLMGMGILQNGAAPMQIVGPGNVTAPSIGGPNVQPTMFTPDFTAQLVASGFDPQMVANSFTPEMAKNTFSPEQLQSIFTPEYAKQNFKAERANVDFNPLLANADFTNELYSGQADTQMADLQKLLGANGFNTGQDALMQMLRSDPQAKSSQVLESIIGGQGDPYNMTGLFDALDARNARSSEDQIAALRAGSSGLGQRFGTGTQMAESDLRSRLEETAAAQRNALGFQAYEAGQGRRMSALGQLAGNEQFGATNDAAIAQALVSGGLQAGNLGLQANQANNQTAIAQEQLKQSGMAQNNQANLNQAALLAQITGQNNQTQLAGQDLQLQATNLNNQYQALEQQLGMGTVEQNNRVKAQMDELRQQAANLNNQWQAQRQTFDLQTLLQNNNANAQKTSLDFAAAAQNNQALSMKDQLAMQAAAQNNQTNLAGQNLLLGANQANNQSALGFANLGQQAQIANQGATLQAAGMNSQNLLNTQQLQLGANNSTASNQQNMLQMLLGSQNQRQAMNNQMMLGSAGLGAPVASPGYGGAIGDIGQFIAMMSMMNQKPTTPAGAALPGAYNASMYTSLPRIGLATSMTPTAPDLMSILNNQRRFI